MRFLIASIAGMALTIAAASAETAGVAASAGPGVMTCRASGPCNLGIGTPPKLIYKVDLSTLPDADKTRSKDCKAGRAKPCIVGVHGNEMGDPLKLKADKITWYN